MYRRCRREATSEAGGRTQLIEKEEEASLSLLASDDPRLKVIRALPGYNK